MPHPRPTPFNHSFLPFIVCPSSSTVKLQVRLDSTKLTEAHLSGETVYHYFAMLREPPGVPKQRPDDDPTIAVPGYYSIDEAFRFLSPAIRWSFAGSGALLPSVFCRQTWSCSTPTDTDRGPGARQQRTPKRAFLAEFRPSHRSANMHYQSKMSVLWSESVKQGLGEV